jgi:FKBP-type peptidyl-prolyl cis-trans isomerase SlyD
MEIANNTVTSVTYALTVDDQLVEQTDSSNPLTFLVGSGNMIPGFETQLKGLNKGDNYEIKIEPAEGYGEVNPEAVVDLPKDVFVVDGKIQEDLLVEGNVIPLQDNNGNPLQGIVKEVKEDAVKMDFNHQLAGKELHFKGEVLDVREATPVEVEHGHVHGEGGVEH